MPVSIVGILMVAIFVADPPYLRRGLKRVDWQGILLLSVALTSMQVILERGQQQNWFDSNMIRWGTAVCVVSFIGLIYWELKADEPVVNVRILRNLPLSLGSIMGVVFGIALFGTTFILPQFTQELLGYSAYEAGLILAPRAFMLLLCMPLVGRLYNPVDARILVLFGTLVTCWSYYDLARLSLEQGFWDLVPTLMIMGIGMPFMFITLSTLSLSTIPKADMTDASSLYTLARRVGGNIGYALVATLVARGQQIHRVELSAFITPYNPNLADFQRQAADLLVQAGLNPAMLQQAKLGLLNTLVNRQATMMAYNDVSWILGFLFLATIPITLLLPVRRRKRHGQDGTA
ncbi:MFS transporter [Desulfosarcina cetonica]|uniref:MFS transporter n=1 Tax=Desulfosarcina cetonica TaxID=90730 RepID=UPI00248BBD58|nr:MFS transporter [Desulfosarcina cetonica]